MVDTSARISLYTFFNDLLALEHAIGYFPFLESDDDNKMIISELGRRLLEAK